jgi:hypothetical protein
MRKVQKLSLAVILCLGALFFSSHIAMAAEENPRSTVIAAYYKLAELKSYHMTTTGLLSMAAEGKTIEVNINNESDIFIRPLLCKSNMDITMKADGKVTNDSIVQYVERSGKRIFTYAYTKGKWERKSLPGGEYNPARDFGDFVKAIKSAQLVSEDDNYAVYEVTADGRYLKECFRRSMETIDISKKDIPDVLLGALGDLTYRLTIDKNAGTISGMDIDFSQFIADFGNRLTSQLPDSDGKKQELVDMFNSMQAQMSFSLSRFDSVEEFTIPDEARAD